MLLIVVTPDGDVQNRILFADRDYSQSELVEAGNYINQNYAGQSFEDVRQRINVISEMPGAWRLLLRRWHSLNRGARRMRAGAPAPSRSDEYMLYQTLLGSFPAASSPSAGKLPRSVW